MDSKAIGVAAIVRRARVVIEAVAAGQGVQAVNIAAAIGVRAAAVNIAAVTAAWMARPRSTSTS